MPVGEMAEYVRTAGELIQIYANSLWVTEDGGFILTRTPLKLDVPIPQRFNKIDILNSEVDFVDYLNGGGIRSYAVPSASLEASEAAPF